MIWFRPGGAERDERDEARPTVPLGSLEAVCDSEEEAAAVRNRFGRDGSAHPRDGAPAA